MASERFPSEAPHAKRAKSEQTGVGRAKEPLLPRNNPLRHKVADTFEILHLTGHTPHIPPELQEIIFDYLAPTALQLLAADQTAVLRNGKMPTKLFEDALREIFLHFASRSMTSCGKEGVMDRDDCLSFFRVEDAHLVDGFLRKHGMPHWNGPQHVAFDGFVVFYLSRPDTHNRDELVAFANYLYPR